MSRTSTTKTTRPGSERGQKVSRPVAPNTKRRAPRDPESQALRGDFAYRALRDEIRKGELAPGDRLRETEIAERLGVSRTPVREALKRLESDGLAEFGQTKGLSVAKLARRQILDLYAIREILEGTAARFAAERAGPVEIEALRSIVAQHKGIKSPELAAEANRRLHDAILAAAHNEYLERMATVLADALALLGPTTYRAPGRIASGWKENAEIVQCIAQRDAAAAEEAARRHIRAAVALRLAMSGNER